MESTAFDWVLFYEGGAPNIFEGSGEIVGLEIRKTQIAEEVAK